MKFWSPYIIQVVPVERVILNSYQSRVLCKPSNILIFHLFKVFSVGILFTHFSMKSHNIHSFSLRYILHVYYSIYYCTYYIHTALHTALQTTYILNKFSGTSIRRYNCCIYFSQMLFCLLAVRSWHPLPVGFGDIEMESQKWITVECGIITAATCWCNICLTCIGTGSFILALFLTTATSLSVVLLGASLNHPLSLCLQVERSPGGAQMWSPGVYLHLVSTFISGFCFVDAA